MDFYSKLTQRVLVPAWENKIRKRPTLKYLAELQSSETSPLSVLRALQDVRMRALLEHAFNHVPYYRHLFQNSGVEVETLRQVTDLSRIPILTRERARKSVDSRLSDLGPRIAVTKTTGGTTGEPLVIRYDQESEYRRQAMRLRGFGWAGYRVGQKALHYWGTPTKPDETFKHRFKKALDHQLKREKWIDCTPRGDEAKAKAVKAIASHRPKTIFCYAQAAVDLARYINAHQCRDWGDITLVCGAEKIYPDDRKVLVQAFGPEVYETYGCREFMLIATECSEHKGMHASMEHLIVEIVDDDGQALPDGTLGNVVVTDLFNYGSPMIRYQNGDMASMSDDQTPCPCGRAHRRIHAVEGRKTETLRDGAGNSVGGMIFNLIFSPMAAAVDQFQCVQHADDSITLKVKSRGALSSEVRDHIRTQTERYLPGIPIHIEEVDSIPLTKSGKRRIVIVEPSSQ